MRVAAAIGIIMALGGGGDHAAIARIDGTDIVRISCPPELSETVCISGEQARLDRLARPLLISAAARLHNVVVSDADAQAASVPVSNGTMANANATLRRLAAAALRVREGEAQEAAYDRDLRPHGVTRHQFEASLRLYDTAEKARQAANLDVSTAVRDQLREQARRRIQADRLSAVAAGDDVRFWADVISRTDTKILDHRFHMPDMKGVLSNVSHAN